MRIDYRKHFIKRMTRAPGWIQEAFQKRLALFIVNKHDRQLVNHSLKGKWSGFHSINITGDWRAIYHQLGDGRIEWVEFVEIGTHSELYR